MQPDAATDVDLFGPDFQDAGRFDPNRDRLQHHLAFGMGRHTRIGNPLAGMEAVISVQVLAGQIAALAVLHREPPRYNASFMVRGLLELPVWVHRRPPA